MRAGIVFTVSLAFLGTPSPTRAEKVEVAPSVRVERRTYPVAANEAPFFNFAQPTEKQRAANEQFIQAAILSAPGRTKAADLTIAAGWQALIGRNDLSTAAKRFNQAYLLDPKRSGVYHGFGAIAASRFADFDGADELLRVAATLDDPAKTLSGDHGRVLLLAKRPADAKPMLEKAIKDDPQWAVPQANLAWALFLTGDRAGACRMAHAVAGRDLQAVANDIALLKDRAACGA